jgi:hypothetical protein
MVQVEGGQLRLETANSPTVPAAGGVKLLGLDDATRVVPAFLGLEGVVRELQPSLGRSGVYIWKVSPNSTTVAVFGLASPTVTGTGTAEAMATTNVLTYSPRGSARVTAASATAVAGYRSQAVLVTIGGAAAGRGGFAYVGRWFPATGVSTATTRAFAGLSTSTAAPTDVEPSGLTNQIGMGWDAADTNVQIMHNDGSGACTKVDLGSSFPVPTVDASVYYELSMYSPPGTTQIVYWQVKELISNVVTSGNFNTNIPGTANFLGPRFWMSVGGTSSVIGVGLVSMYLDGFNV